MTPSDIIQHLETLKDAFAPHDARHALLTRIQKDLSAIPAEKVVEIEKPVEKEVVKPAPGDRRDAPRDPGEIEQHLAEALKLAPKPRG